VTEYTYDPAGRLVTMQDAAMRAEGRVRVWTYDALGRVTEVRETADSGQEWLLSETYYDTYPSSAAAFVAQEGYDGACDLRTKGFKTCEILSIEGSNDQRIVTYYYDSRGNVIQTVENDADGRAWYYSSETGKFLAQIDDDHI